jgi:hypothetical protein
MKKSVVLAVASIFVCLQSAYPQITTNELPVSVQRGLGVVTKDKTIGTVDLPALEVYNASTGKKVFGKKIGGTFYTIDTTGWEPGVYIIKAIIGEEVLSEKTIVK